MAWAPRFLALSAALVAACGSVQNRPPLHPYNPPGTWYLLQPGETLTDVATRVGVPLDDILEINGLRRGARVEPGRLLYVLYPDGARIPEVVERTPEPVPYRPPPRPGSSQLRWPLAEPRLTSAFGVREGRPHEGIDLGAATGTPILAAKEGQVVYAGDGVRGYGNMVVVSHDASLMTVYAHSSVLLVRTGEKVTAGQEIARVGQSGRATAPHLHFEVRDRQRPQDPLRFLPALPGGR